MNGKIPGRDSRFAQNVNLIDFCFDSNQLPCVEAVYLQICIPNRLSVAIQKFGEFLRKKKPKQLLRTEKINIMLSCKLPCVSCVLVCKI